MRLGQHERKSNRKQRIPYKKPKRRLIFRHLCSRKKLIQGVVFSRTSKICYNQDCIICQIVQNFTAANICFFGLNRSLSTTIHSIKKYLLNPLEEKGCNISIFGAFCRVNEYSNTRSGEAAVAPENNEQSLINFNEVQYVNQEAFEDLVRWDLAFRYGDYYGQINTPEDSRNLNSTTKNIFRSLFALKTSFNLIPANLQDRPTIFVRPDLKILSSLDFNTYSSLIFKQKIQRKYGHTDGIALVPNWHSWNGLNDRFAICTPGNASKSYANRYDHLIPYIELSKHPLHPETFLYQIMHACRVEVLAVISTKMARIRANGIPHPEDFSQGEGVGRFNYFNYK